MCVWKLRRVETLLNLSKFMNAINSEFTVWPKVNNLYVFLKTFLGGSIIETINDVVLYIPSTPFFSIFKIPKTHFGSKSMIWPKVNIFICIFLILLLTCQLLFQGIKVARVFKWSQWHGIHFIISTPMDRFSIFMFPSNMSKFLLRGCTQG